MKPLRRVVGIDLSLTGTGLAEVTHHTGPEVIDNYLGTQVRTITSTGKRADSLERRRERLDRLVEDVAHFAAEADLIVVEGPSLVSKGGSNWDRAGLWWLVIDYLIGRNLPVAIAPPTVVKKFAAGKGNADKTSVAVGLARLWGEGTECRNDNEWDALALATMGAQRIGIPDVPERAHHAGALASVAWPMAGE